MSEGIDYLVFSVPLPGTVHGFICKRKTDDMPVIVINDNLTDERKKTALNHELTHLENNHLYQYDIPVYQIERSMG